MAQSFLQPFLFLFIIVLANLLKRGGVFKESEGKVLSQITLNITLPAAIIAGFDSIQMDYALLIFILMGIAVNMNQMAIAYLLMHKENNFLKSYALLNGATYNIGNFSFPFIQTLFGAPGLVIAALFDLGNALMTTGFTYSVAASVAGGQRPNIADLIKKLFSSVPFVAYLFMLTLSMLGLHLPVFFSEWMQSIGKANPIIAMLMIGIMLDIHFEKGWLKHTIKMLGVRYLGASVFSFAIYQFTDYSHMIKVTLILLFFSPISTMAAAFTQKCTNNGKLSSFTTSISVVVSIVCYMVLVPLLGV
ncbi:MAG: permease [Sphaerochaeta sp.]|nr:permease [Sphaerochaeta sp.]